MHTAFLDRFCTNIGLVPADHHAEFNVDYTYTYHFCMDRFSTLDQFLLSTRLYDTCVQYINVQHNVDNISDHDPIFIRMNLSCNRNSSSTRTFKWHLVKATTDDLNCYRDNLSSNLKSISIPYSALLFHDMKCKECQYYDAITQYLNDITEACLSAGHASSHTVITVVI